MQRATINKLLKDRSDILPEHSFPNEQLLQNACNFLRHFYYHSSSQWFPVAIHIFKFKQFIHPKAPLPTEMHSILSMLRYSELPKQIPAPWRRKCYNLPCKLYLFMGKIPSKQQTTVQKAPSTCHQLSLRIQQVLYQAGVQGTVSRQACVEGVS